MATGAPPDIPSRNSPPALLMPPGKPTKLLVTNSVNNPLMLGERQIGDLCLGLACRAITFWSFFKRNGNLQATVEGQQRTVTILETDGPSLLWLAASNSLPQTHNHEYPLCLDWATLRAAHP
eukprot:8765312-Lingulodinium_polyedra.AAC.1